MSIESQYLAWLDRQKEKYPQVFSDSTDSNYLGIGDDAAVFQGGQSTVCCTDMVAEGSHFRLTDDRSLQLAGRKSLAVNISDFAAMGAIPTDAFLSILVNRSDGLNQAIRITSGLIELAQQYQIRLTGGDTCSSNGPVVINVALVGRPGRHTITRSGARPGDVIVCTGSFGGSILQKHWMFEPRINEARQITDLVVPTAMTDVTDGLARDLYSIVGSGKVGASIDAFAIPISTDAKEATANQSVGNDQAQLDPALSAALNDGEDFELLLTLSPSDWKTLQEAIASGKWSHKTGLTEIGTIESQPGVRLNYNGDQIPLPPGGFDH